MFPKLLLFSSILAFFLVSCLEKENIEPQIDEGSENAFFGRLMGSKVTHTFTHPRLLFQYWKNKGKPTKPNYSGIKGEFLHNLHTKDKDYRDAFEKPSLKGIGHIDYWTTYRNNSEFGEKFNCQVNLSPFMKTILNEYEYIKSENNYFHILMYKKSGGLYDDVIENPKNFLKYRFLNTYSLAIKANCIRQSKEFDLSTEDQKLLKQFYTILEKPKEEFVKMFSSSQVPMLELYRLMAEQEEFKSWFTDESIDTYSKITEFVNETIQDFNYTLYLEELAFLHTNGV